MLLYLLIYCICPPDTLAWTELVNGQLFRGHYIVKEDKIDICENKKHRQLYTTLLNDLRSFDSNVNYLYNLTRLYVDQTNNRFKQEADSYDQYD